MKSNTFFVRKFAIFALFITLGVGLVPAARAYADVSVAPEPGIPTCYPLNQITQNLYFGSRDAYTNGEVSKLQTFLNQKGYFSYPSIGIFGPLTLASVQRFQAANGVSSTGYVGPITRGVIQRMLCGNPVPPESSVNINSISPTSGAVGTTVSITGYGFTSDNTVLFAGGAIRNVPVSSSIAIACTTDPNCRGGIRQTLLFTVPSSIGPNCPPGSLCPLYARLVTPGDYQISVQNTNGTSNAVTFTVTSGNPFPGQQPLTISGLDAPAHLSVGDTGSFTIHVSDIGASSNLHYSIVWGDELQTLSPASASFARTIQPSASVTHTYTRSGTFTPVFTVTNDAGQSANISSTVVVN
ncbi:peptidoglycan-binding protein [Patescibacteria group bacterium]|nr:peptidoglycan-binding protein [Patescibacteria group bacterium]